MTKEQEIIALRERLAAMEELIKQTKAALENLACYGIANRELAKLNAAIEELNKNHPGYY